MYCFVIICFWQFGGAIFNDDGTVDITGSKFGGNTSDGGNNIEKFSGEVTCKDVGNTFDSPGGNAEDDDSNGNFPAGLCTSTPYYALD